MVILGFVASRAKAGAVLALVGALLMAASAFAPSAQAQPHGNGNGYGWWNNHPAPTATSAPSGNGANNTGPYDPNGVGLPSGNGNGNGNANGKPCAGCVGNADDKNPPGQMPGPNDHNNGYECDGNSGIGKTNPAHTGCDTGSGGSGG